MSQPEPEIVDRFTRVQAATAASAARDVALLLLALDLADLDAAWAAIRDRVVAIIAAQQLLSAATAAAFVSALVRLAGHNPQSGLPPLAFVGWTSAGMPVADLVDATPYIVKAAIAAGVPPPQALQSVTVRTARAATSEVQDAGRGMVEAQTRLEPQVTGWVRHVTLPACGRCLILAGRFYPKASAFVRHPQDDCQQIPVFGPPPDVGRLPTDLFHQMTDAQQGRAFTRDGARAIRDGADPASIVNARSGMDFPADPYTRGRRGRTRLSPQGIARQAGDDTVLYRRLLRENGYLSSP